MGELSSVNLEIAAALLNSLNEYRDKIFSLWKKQGVSVKKCLFISFYLLPDTASLRVLLKLKLNWSLNIGWPFNIIQVLLLQFYEFNVGQPDARFIGHCKTFIRLLRLLSSNVADHLAQITGIYSKQGKKFSGLLELTASLGITVYANYKHI